MSALGKPHGLGVAEACAEVALEGAWLVDPRGDSPKAKASAPSAERLRQDLLKAVMGGDLAEAKKLERRGAKPAAVRGDSGMGLFELWARADKKDQTKSSAVAMALWLEESGCPIDIRATSAGLSIRSRSLRLGGAPRLQSRIEGRQMWMATKRKGTSLDYESCPLTRAGLVAVAKRWDALPEEDRVPLQSWLDQTMAQGNPNRAIDTDMLATWVEAGAELSAAGWDQAVEKVSSAADLARLLECEPNSDKISEATRAAMLVCALRQDSARLLGALGSRFSNMSWRLPMSAWSARELESQPAALILMERGVGMSALQGAIVLNQARWVKVDGAVALAWRDCFRALARIPSMVEDAGRCSWAFLNASLAEIKIISELCPNLALPGCDGETFAHAWVRKAKGVGACPDLELLLSGELAWMASAKGIDGKTPIEIELSRGDSSARGREALAAAFAKWELREIAKNVSGAPSQPGSRL